MTTVVANPGFLDKFLDAQRLLMEKYGSSIEQILLLLLNFQPVNDEEDDRVGLKGQALYSLVDLFNLYKGMLLRPAGTVPVVTKDPAQHQMMCRVYGSSAFVLRAIRSVQALIELHMLRQHGGDHALRLCLRLEVSKLCIKALLFSLLPFRFSVDEEALETIPPNEKETGGANQSPNFVGSRSGRKLPALRSLGGVASSSSAVGSITHNVTPSSPALYAAELLFHLRPVFHIALLRRRGMHSWAAWCFAFLTDRISLHCLETSLRRFEEGSTSSAMEWAEVRRRRACLSWCLARSPCFDKLFKGIAERLNNLIKRIPVINLFNLLDLLLALQPLYFSTSAT